MLPLENLAIGSQDGFGLHEQGICYYCYLGYLVGFPRPTTYLHIVTLGLTKVCLLEDRCASF